MRSQRLSLSDVRPLAGAGIEMVELRPGELRFLRFAPSRGRELKLDEDGHVCWEDHVRPLAGAGIEIEKP